MDKEISSSSGSSHDQKPASASIDTHDDVIEIENELDINNEFNRIKLAPKDEPKPVTSKNEPKPSTSIQAIQHPDSGHESITKSKSKTKALPSHTTANRAKSNSSSSSRKRRDRSSSSSSSTSTSSGSTRCSSSSSSEEYVPYFADPKREQDRIRALKEAKAKKREERPSDKTSGRRHSRDRSGDYRKSKRSRRDERSASKERMSSRVRRNSKERYDYENRRDRSSRRDYSRYRRGRSSDRSDPRIIVIQVPDSSLRGMPSHPPMGYPPYVHPMPIPYGRMPPPPPPPPMPMPGYLPMYNYPPRPQMRLYRPRFQHQNLYRHSSRPPNKSQH